MENKRVIRRFIGKDEEGSYFLIPFEVEPLTERIDIAYEYPRTCSDKRDGMTLRRTNAVIDLFVLGPGGRFLGSSGSDRSAVWVSGYDAAEGFAPTAMEAGQWAIGVGAYHVPDEGVEVVYTVTLTAKHRRLLRGDIHVHTTGSDGWLPPEETAALAARMGLDYLFITDHNNYAHNEHPPRISGLTVMPGAEWTHYRGHAGLLGVVRPFEGSFHTNTKSETAALLARARRRGAMAVLNHPFCPLCPWTWGFDGVEYDAVEVWNGAMSERNVRAVAWWHGQLCAGRRIPAVGGSDYHKPGLFGGIAMPCACLWALSREPADIMAALRGGHGYISYLPEGPGVDAVCGGRGLGDAVERDAEVSIRFFNLKSGDILRFITDQGEENLTCPDGAAQWELTRRFGDALFCRFEVIRSYETGLPPMTAMVSNPVYFE